MPAHSEAMDAARPSATATSCCAPCGPATPTRSPPPARTRRSRAGRSCRRPTRAPTPSSSSPAPPTEAAAGRTVNLLAVDARRPAARLVRPHGDRPRARLRRDRLLGRRGRARARRRHARRRGCSPTGRAASSASRAIEILPHKDNAPSRRVAEKAGFRDTGGLVGAPRGGPRTSPCSPSTCGRRDRRRAAAGSIRPDGVELTYCVVNTEQRQLLSYCLDAIARERAAVRLRDRDAGARQRVARRLGRTRRASTRSRPT